MPEPTPTKTNPWLIVIAVLLGTFALRESYPVTMPMAVTLVIIAAVWPIKPWLDRLLPSSFSYAGMVLALLVVLCAITAAVYFAAIQVVFAFSHDWDRIQTVYADLDELFTRIGLELSGQQGYAALVGFGQQVLGNAYTVLVYLGFIMLLVALGLPEVPALRRKLARELERRERNEVMDAAGDVGRKIRSYMGVATLTSALTGILCALWPLALGLDLYIVWGLIAFLLNYIPVIGSFAAIIPPTLYAVIQFQTWTWPLVAFVGFATIEIVIGNVVYPMLQGRSLALSPLAVLVVLTFWGWVWGLAGALIAIPLTTTLLIVLEHFKTCRWLVVVLSDPDHTDDHAHWRPRFYRRAEPRPVRSPDPRRDRLPEIDPPTMEKNRP